MVEPVGNRYKAMAVSTQYWKPGDDYLRIILKSLKNLTEDRDFIILSEKALSTALKNVVDESFVKPGRMARLIAKYWMKYVWGSTYFCRNV